MNTIINLMLAVRERTIIFYHKDTKQFDYYPFSEIEREKMSLDALIPYNDLNNYSLPSFEEINHKEIMRFYVKECLEDKAIRTQLFDMLRRTEYMDVYLDKLRELNLYDDFIGVCGDLYVQIFEEWAYKNGLVEFIKTDKRE